MFTWVEAVAISLSPALLLFLGAGVMTIYKRVKSRLTESNEEIKHEL